MLDALFRNGTSGLRRSAPLLLFNLYEEWLSSSQAATQSMGLRALIPIIEDQAFENLPPVFRLLSPQVQSSSAPLFTDLQHELEHLRQSDPEVVETTVLIHPYVLQDFYDYNDFLGVVDELIESGGYAGEFQVASLHPDYQFAGTQPGDAENYTNRSPYPILHLLREELLARAISSYARPDKIPERNIRVMNELGAAKMQAMLDECMKIAQARNSVPSPSGGGLGRGQALRDASSYRSASVPPGSVPIKLPCTRLAVVPLSTR